MGKSCQILIGASLIVKNHRHQALTGCHKTSKDTAGLLRRRRLGSNGNSCGFFYPDPLCQIILCSGKRRLGQSPSLLCNQLCKAVADIIAAMDNEILLRFFLKTACPLIRPSLSACPLMSCKTSICASTSIVSPKRRTVLFPSIRLRPMVPSAC